MRRVLAFVACTLAAALAGRVAAEDAPPRVAVLEWTAGPPEAYYEHVVPLRLEGTMLAAGSVPFGPGATLHYGSVGWGVLGFRLDRDFDGDLEDEKPVDFDVEIPDLTDLKKLMSGKLPDMFLSATECVHPPWADAAGLEKGVRVLLRIDSFDAPKELVLVPLLHLRGHVVLGGRNRVLVVYDGNGDLAFDDPEQDRVFLDLDGDRAIPRHVDSHERIVPGRPFGVREETIVASVDTGTRSVAFRPSAGRPVVGCPWPPETLPPAGTVPEGAFRSLETIRAEYEAKRAEIRRRRGGGVLLIDLVAEAGRVGTPEAFEFLELAYRQDDEPTLRRSVVEAMGDRRYVDHAPVLLAIAAKARDADLQVACIHALHAMDAPGRDEVLLKMAKGAKDDRAYAEAVRYAAATGTAQARTGLLALLSRCGRNVDRAYETYVAATRWLAEVPSEELVQRASRVKSPRLQALAMLDARVLPYPGARDLALACAKQAPGAAVLREAVVEVLGGTGDEASTRALLGLVDDLAPEARARAAALLRAVRDHEAVGVLLEALGHSSSCVRALAAEVVAGLEAEGTGVVLAERLRRESDPAVLAELARAVGLAGAKEAVPALLEILRRKDPGEDVVAEGVIALLAVGWGDPDVLAFFDKVLEHGADESRLRVVDGAVASGSPRAVAILVKGLDDALWQIRAVAARGLGRLRRKEAVPALIRRLGLEDRGCVRQAVADALFRITGMFLYDVEERWRAWWEAEGATFEVPQAVPPVPEVDPGRVYGTFYGVPVVSDHCIFVIDQSGSMSSPAAAEDGRQGAKTELERAVDETLAVVGGLPDGGFANVLLFESDVHAWADGLVELDKGSRARLQTFLREQQPTGATNLHDALAQALRTADVDTVYLLSDGMPTDGRYVEDDDIVESIRRINWRQRAVIHCVSLGWESDLLKRLAALTGGTYLVR